VEHPVVNRQAPIGVFDSGLGGLTVAGALLRELPQERILYFGDTARVPYGPKSPDTVRRYAHEISDWLRDEGVKAIVVACNTATAHALSELVATVGVPVIGVVEPGARAAVEHGPGPIGIIGTAGTIASGAYAKAVWALAPETTIVSQACPLFVPLVEEGWTDHPATRLIAREYLAPLLAARVRSVVLGCTHYPLLRPLLTDVLGPQVSLIDSAAATAAATARLLAAHDLLRTADDTAVGPHRFVASDAPEQFLRFGQRFLGAAIEQVELVTLG
jgi:glutamate racemase